MYRRADNGTIIMAIANHKFLDFVLNWAHYIRKVQMDHYIVGTLDGELLPLLAKNKIHSVSLSDGKLEQGGWVRVVMFCLRFLLYLFSCGICMS